jgi:hypothetical protein
VHHKLIALAGLMLLPAGAQAATRSYIVTDFDSLRLEGPIDVSVQTGRGAAARGEGDRDLLERVDLSVSARVLTIRLKPSPYEARRSGAADTIRLSISVPALRRIQLSGAGSLRSVGLGKGRAEIMMAGSGALDISGIDADTLSLAQFGTGSVLLAGKAKSAGLRVSGAGALDGKALSVTDLDLKLEGAAMVETSAVRTAKIVAVGPGSVIVEGKAACTVSHAGSGAVRCGGRDY